MFNVYVLDRRGNPLMPTRRYGWVRRALKSGKAKAVCTLPFTIKLMYDPDTTKTQDITLGIDPGRTNIGMATADGTGRCLYSSQCETRNKEVPKLMEKRRQNRQASRRGERLTRKRLAKRLGTTMKNILERMLPGYEKPVRIKDIINTEARFNNRRRREGWLTPTAMQLLRTHLNLIEKVCRILPISGIALEANRFAFMELEAGDGWNPEWITSAGPCMDTKASAKPWRRFRTEGACCAANVPLNMTITWFPGQKAEAIPWQTWQDCVNTVIPWYIRIRKPPKSWKPSRQARTKSTALYPY